MKIQSQTEFKEAVKELAFDLKIDLKNITWDLQDPSSSKNLWYAATGKNKKYEFKFCINHEKKPFIDIKNSNSSNLFHFNENLSANKFLSPGRFVRRAAYNFNLEYNPIKLSSIFTNYIFVLGIPGYSAPSDFLIKLILLGVRNFQNTKLKVYRFRHLSSDDQVKFSYAFWLEGGGAGRYDSNFWILFPNAAGFPSGGATADYEYIEGLIEELNKKKKVVRYYLDIDYSEFERFLLRKQLKLRSSDTGPDSIDPFDLPTISKQIWDKQIETEYEDFRAKYSDEKYTEALADLRGILQDVLELMCNKNNIALGNKETLKSLADKLYNRSKNIKVIDDYVYHSINTFLAGYGNRSAHTRKTLIGQQANDRLLAITNRIISERRFFLSILIGVQILKELECVSSPSFRD